MKHATIFFSWVYLIFLTPYVKMFPILLNINSLDFISFIHFCVLQV